MSYAAASVEHPMSSMNSINMHLQQIELCSILAICHNNGTNSAFLVNIPSFMVKQIFKQENVCKGNNTNCVNLGSNDINASNTNQKQILIDINQRLKQLNRCESGTSCENDGNNQALVGTSFNAFGGITDLSLSNLNSDLNQRLKQGNGCSSNNTFCHNDGFNDFELGVANAFGGVANLSLSKIDSVIKQMATQNNQCADFSFCDNFGGNGASIGVVSSLFGGNAIVSISAVQWSQLIKPYF